MLVFQGIIGLIAFFLFFSLAIRLIIKHKKLGVKQDKGFLIICFIYFIYGASIVLFSIAPGKWFLNVKSLL
jgi:hypothetical protein